MKIVIITPYWLQTKGGIATAVYCLSKELKQNGYSVTVLTPDYGTDTIKLPKNRSLLIWEAIRILRDLKPEVVHVHAHGSLLLPVAIYKRLFNRKVNLIFTFHTQPHTKSFLTGKPAKERGLIRQAIFNRLLTYCDATTYVSKSLMNSLEKTGIKIVKPVVIPNGVIEKKVSSEDIINFKQKYNLIDDYPVLCMIASLAWDWKVKGIEILIRAFKKALSFQSRAKLLIIGDGQYRKYLEDFVEKENLKGQVIFTGNMDNPFIALSACDIYCHISLNEAMPIAPLEAMIAGKPIIASNDGGLPEIITDDVDGILVNSDPDSVAKAILSLIEKPELMKKLSRNAVITAKTKFSWEKITEEYIKLYKNE
jgi:glycosyltransferase involved in cell wall biosynthesis